MDCLLCNEKVYYLSCYWMGNRIIECCSNCAKKNNLNGVEIRSIGKGFEKIFEMANNKMKCPKI